MEFPDFFSKIKWWSDASIEAKLEKAFSLFFGNGLAATKEDVVILLDAIFPCLSRPTLVDIAKSVILSAQIESMLLQGKHKFVEGISKKEFVDWMWRCQFAPKYGCGKDMLSVDFKGKRRASWEVRNPLQRGSTHQPVQPVHIKVSQASVKVVASSAAAGSSEKKGSSNIINNNRGEEDANRDELVPDEEDSGLAPPDFRRVSQGSKNTRRSSGTTGAGSNFRSISLNSTASRSSRRNSRNITSQHAQRGSVVAAGSVITEEKHNTTTTI